MRARNRTRDDLRELPGVVKRVTPLYGDEHMHSLGTRRLRKPDEPERIERLLDEQRDLHRLLETDVGRRIEIEEHEVGTVRLVDARVPRVHVDATHVHHPEQAQLVVHEREVHPLLLARRLARRDEGAVGRDPVRHVRRRVFLEEPPGLDPVGPAHHRERAVLQVRDEDGRNRAVVLDQLALGDPFLREEDLVEVRELELALALPDPVGDRLFAAHLVGGLVLP